jgi:hypothetical protein
LSKRRPSLSQSNCAEHQAGRRRGDDYRRRSVKTSGDNVITVEIDGDVGQVEIAGGVVAEGNDSDAIHARSMVSGLTDVSIKTANGQDVVQTH